MPDEKKGNGRAKFPCACCGGADCAEMDWNGSSGPVLICADCGIMFEFSGKLHKRPDAAPLEAAGLHSNSLALCGTKEMKDAHDTHDIAHK